MSSTKPPQNQDPTCIYKIAPAQPTPRASSSPSSSSSNEGDTNNNKDGQQPILPPSPLDISSQYIHMSTAAQVPGTLARFFATDASEENVVWLLKVSVRDVLSLSGRNGDVGELLRWESPDGSGGPLVDGGEVFPHLYFDDDVVEHDKEDGARKEERSAGGGFVEGTEGRSGRRLWLRRKEVLSLRKVVSGVGETGWEGGLAEVLLSDDDGKEEPWLV